MTEDIQDIQDIQDAAPEFDPEAILAETEAAMARRVDDLVRHLGNKMRKGPVHDAETIMNARLTSFSGKTALRDIASYRLRRNLTLEIELALMGDPDLPVQVEQAVRDTNLGTNVERDGYTVSLRLRRVEGGDRRKLNKVVTTEGEKAKAKVRDVRRGAVKAGLSKHDARLKDLTDKFVDAVNGVMEVSLMTVDAM